MEVPVDLDGTDEEMRAEIYAAAQTHDPLAFAHALERAAAVMQSVSQSLRNSQLMDTPLFPELVDAPTVDSSFLGESTETSCPPTPPPPSTKRPRRWPVDKGVILREKRPRTHAPPVRFIETMEGGYIPGRRRPKRTTLFKPVDLRAHETLSPWDHYGTCVIGPTGRFMSLDYYRTITPRPTKTRTMEKDTDYIE